jgi:hypothetical protein
MKTKSIKNYLKISAFLLLALLLFKNCESDNENLEIETETISNRTFGTVPIHQAKIFFNRKMESNEDDSFFGKSSNSIGLTPNWETLEYEELYQIDEAQLLSANVDINRNGNYKSKLIFINVNGQVKNAIYTIYEERTNANGTVLDARIYLNETDGTFIDGYKIQERKFTKRYVVNSNGNVSQGSMFPFFQDDTEDDCWNTDNLPEDGQLDEVDLGTLPGSSGGYNPDYGGIYTTVRDWNDESDSSGPSSGSGGYTGVAGTLYGNNVDTEDEPEDDVLIQINQILANNPFLLLEMDCSQIQQWQSLSQFQLQQSTINKILSLQSANPTAYPNWSIQTLQGAGGAIVNLDYFPINILQMPLNPNTGQNYTPEEFLYFFRMNLSSLASGSTSNTSFEPSTITGQDESSLWDSTNPLNTIISINITPDSGSVICSDFNSSSGWIFTTLTTPWAFSFSEDDYDGPHPVSGNREFGYNQNLDGSYTFFTRGVDRFTSGVLEEVANSLSSENQFEGADNLWETIQQNLVNHVNNPDNGGVASVINPVTWRPDWEDVKDVLNGVKPITELDCE